MKPSDAVIGVRVKTLRAFSGVPLGTKGIIDEDYESGIMVAWALPDRPLPTGYRKYDGRSALQSGILRDGFDKKTELIFLEVEL